MLPFIWYWVPLTACFILVLFDCAFCFIAISKNEKNLFCRELIHMPCTNLEILYTRSFSIITYMSITTYIKRCHKVIIIRSDDFHFHDYFLNWTNIKYNIRRYTYDARKVWDEALFDIAWRFSAVSIIWY